MHHRGIAMFFACHQHAQQIWEADWQGWCIDWNATKEQYVIWFDEEKT